MAQNQLPVALTAVLSAVAVLLSGSPGRRGRPLERIAGDTLTQRAVTRPQTKRKGP